MDGAVPPADNDHQTLSSLIQRLAANGGASDRGLWEIFLDAVSDAVIVQDEAGRLVYANPAAAELLERPLASLNGQRVEDLLGPGFTVLDPQGHPLPLEPLPAARVFRDESTPSATIRHRRRSGADAWCVVQARPVVDAAGRPVLAVSLFRDVTTQLRTDEALQFLADAGALLANSLDYETTLQQVTQLVVPRLADWCTVSLRQGDGRIAQVAVAHVDPARVEWARKFNRRFPSSIDDPGGVAQVLRSGQPQLIPEITDEMIAAAVRTPAQLDAAQRVGLKSIMIVPLTARERTLGALSFVQAESGRHYVQADLVLAQQLADRAALAIDNARLYQEAQAALRARSEFLSIASHELKTPLTAVQGQAQLMGRYLDQGQLSESRLRASTGRLLAGVRRLNLLVNDLLDATRLQTGQLTLRPEPVDLAALARGALARVAEHEPPSVTQRHRLTLAAPEPVIGRWDPVRLDQVLVNLIDNAVKYSPDGGAVGVEVHRDGTVAVLVVRDEGVGIPLDDQQRLFQPFARADGTDGVPGTGLGLYIARQIVEQHGGGIDVQSCPGAGSTFTVRLPLTDATSPDPAG